MSKDKYTLTYFRIYGRGEPLRIAMELAKVDYEDVVVDH